jgi:hypothetical protein
MNGQSGRKTIRIHYTSTMSNSWENLCAGESRRIFNQGDYTEYSKEFNLDEQAVWLFKHNTNYKNKP